MTTNENERAVKFVAVWERLGNSGIIEFTASSHKDAKSKVEYLGSHCKVTIYQVSGDKLVFGEMK